MKETLMPILIFSLLLFITGCTDAAYVSTLNNQTIVQSGLNVSGNITTVTDVCLENGTCLSNLGGLNPCLQNNTYCFLYRTTDNVVYINYSDVNSSTLNVRLTT